MSNDLPLSEHIYKLIEEDDTNDISQREKPIKRTVFQEIQSSFLRRKYSGGSSNASIFLSKTKIRIDEEEVKI
jgi:hypothetical protein